MPSGLTIVMYHYVRDLARSRFPAIRALTIDAFRGQLGYIANHYQIVTMESVLDALANGGSGLPPRAALLTFDDGYADHYDHVLPILDQLGVQGSFFPPARPVLEGVVVDVNKIHFILASASQPTELPGQVIAAIDARRERFGLRPGADYWAAFDEPARYDTKEVTFVKRVLQKMLPEAPRSEIVDELFRRHVTDDESAFARELYVSLDQLRDMRRHGMFIGSHGYSHVWLNAIGQREQESEIERSLDFLHMIEPAMKRWVMCYPYGGYDETTVEVLRGHGCAAGLCVDVGIADLRTTDRFSLPRLDTNDLPCDPSAPASSWTRAAAELSP